MKQVAPLTSESSELASFEFFVQPWGRDDLLGLLDGECARGEPSPALNFVSSE
jgi:hypothetical protein